jgi:hypothetical protein
MPMTPSGIEPAAFRFVAQYLNHCATAVPGLVTASNWSKFISYREGKEAGTTLTNTNKLVFCAVHRASNFSLIIEYKTALVMDEENQRVRQRYYRNRMVDNDLSTPDC